MNMSAREQILFAKLIAPNIFKNKTPKFHIEVLDFLNVKHDLKAIVMFRGAGKSTLLNKIHIINRIFFKQEPFTIIVSENSKKAQSFLRDIKRTLVRMAEMGYDIRKGDVWNDSTIEIITGGKMCQISVFGSGEDPRGYVSDNNRPTFIIADDIENRKSVRSAEQREKLEEWFFQDLLPAMDPDGELLIIGTIMHEEQLLSRVLKDEDFQHVIFSCYDDNGDSRWPSRFSKEKLERIMRRYERLGLLNAFYNEYLCVPQNEKTKLFKKHLFKYYNDIRWSNETTTFTIQNAVDHEDVLVRDPEAIMLDNGSEIPITHVMRYSTMDLSSDGADKSAIVTVAFDSDSNWYIMPITSGHFNPFKKSLEAVRVQRELKPIRFGIEKGGGLNDFFYTIDVAQKETDTFIPVEPLNHQGVNKNIRIQNLFQYYSTGKIHHCRTDPQTTFLEAQLGAFNVDIVSKTDDIIDALAYQVHFVSGRTFNNDQFDYDDPYLSGAWDD